MYQVTFDLSRVQYLHETPESKKKKSYTDTQTQATPRRRSSHPVAARHLAQTKTEQQKKYLSQQPAEFIFTSRTAVTRETKYQHILIFYHTAAVAVHSERHTRIFRGNGKPSDLP